MKKLIYKKLYSWLILIGFCLQIISPLIGTIQTQENNLTKKNLPHELITDSYKNETDTTKNTICLHNFDIEKIILHIVEQAIEEGFEKEISKALITCYQSIVEKDGVIDVNTILEAMPELLKYTVEAEKLNRSIRPSEPLTNNSTTSCSNDCSLTQVIYLLSSIRSHIGTIQDTPCCDTILGILGDACSIPCIGENSSISEVICEILNCCTNLSEDITSIFTVLSDIEDTLTFICEKIETDFEGTFTTLTDIENTLTFICEKIETDFEGTFTTLVNIEDTLTFICEKIETGFEGTFTAIINIESSSTFVCEKIETNFEGTFTTLTDIENTLTFICEKIETDFEGTFTTLVNIENTLTFICEKIETGFEGTFTILNNLNLTSSVDLSGIFTVLNECCACNPIPLFQSDVNGDGEILLSVNGQNYCLAENITGTIIISGANVTLDGNDRVITGRIEISNEEVIVKNAKIKPEAPNNNVEAAQAGVEIIGASSTNVQIINCLIECANTTAIPVIPESPGINGRPAIISNGAETIINHCIAKAGNAGNGTPSILPNLGNGGDGGIGAKAIELNGDNCVIIDSNGSGSNGGDGAAGGTQLGDGGSGGNGAIGIETNGENNLIIRSIATGGNGGSGSDSGEEGGNAGNGASGAVGISTTNITNKIIESKGTGGSGGNGGEGFATNGTSGDGESGIQSLNDNTIIKSSVGNGGNGGSSLIAGGNGGSGIEIEGNNNTIKKSIATGGSGSSSSNIGGDGGHGILIFNVDTTTIKKCCALSGSEGGDGDNTGGNGGNGISINENSSNIQICECKINNVGTPGIGASVGTAGDGIHIENTATCIQVTSNRIACCSGFGINNNAGSETTLYNNIATDNDSGNYNGVPFVRTPGPQTGFYVNVTDGPEDCDLCSLFTRIACNHIPLFQSDVVNGEITLSTDGQNYCLAENITGTIVINGANITVDGNDRVVTGRVIIDNEECILKNTKVKPEAPINNTQALQGGIEITTNGLQAQVINCLVECADTVATVAASVTGFSGRIGIESDASETIIEECIVQAGRGGPGGPDSGILPGGTGGTGGIGIILNNPNGIINDSMITGGNGGIGGNSGMGGQGGIGTTIATNNCIIINCTINGGAGSIGGELFGTGGTGGTAMQISGNNNLIKKSNIRSGSGGTGGGVGDGGASGIGIRFLSGSTMNTINKSKVISADGGDGGDRPDEAGNAGNGGNSNFAILCETNNNLQILKSQIIPGNGGNGGLALSPTAGSDGGNGGEGIRGGTSDIIIIDSCSILDGGNGGLPGNGIPAGTGGNGANAITITNSTNIQICNSKINNTGQTNNGGTGADGILILTATSIQLINDKIMNTGAAGIQIIGTNKTEIRDCSALRCTTNGFRIGANAVNCSVISCRATSNDIGFSVDPITAAATLVNNYASRNTSAQFSGGTGTIVTLPPLTRNAGYWANVIP